MKKCKCIKEFTTEAYDVYCFPTADYVTIELGTVWERNDEENMIGGEVHLDRNDGLEWIEIPYEILERCFEELDEVGTE